MELIKVRSSLIPSPSFWWSSQNITEQNQTALKVSSQSLSDYLRTATSFPDDDSEGEDELAIKHMNYEDSVCMAMEQVFKNGVSRPRFKVFYICIVTPQYDSIRLL